MPAATLQTATAWRKSAGCAKRTRHLPIAQTAGHRNACQSARSATTLAAAALAASAKALAGALVAPASKVLAMIPALFLQAGQSQVEKAGWSQHSHHVHLCLQDSKWAQRN